MRFLKVGIERIKDFVRFVGREEFEALNSIIERDAAAMEIERDSVPTPERATSLGKQSLHVLPRPMPPAHRDPHSIDSSRPVGTKNHPVNQQQRDSEKERDE